MSKEIKHLIESYLRSTLAGMATLFLAGVTTPKDLAWSLLAAIAPVLIRYLNPNDPAFGKVPTAAEVDVALKTAKPKKAPAKPAAPKKTAAKPATKKATTK